MSQSKIVRKDSFNRLLDESHQKVTEIANSLQEGERIAVVKIAPKLDLGFHNYGKRKLPKGKKSSSTTNRPNKWSVGIVGDCYFENPRDRGLPRNFISHITSQLAGKISNTGFTQANIRINATAIGPAIDTDSLSSIVPRTAWESVLNISYIRYRVLKSKITATFQNAEAFPVVVGVVPANAPLTLNNSSFPSALQGPLGRQVTLTPVTTAQAQKKLTVKFDSVEFFGNDTALYDDAFVAATNGTGTPSAPTNSIYFQVGSYSEQPAQPQTGAGVTVNLVITQEVLYFERATVLV